MASPAREVTLVLLAAGRAVRMGRPKLALDVDGRMLLERALDACSHHPTIVVVNASSEQLLRALAPREHVVAVVRQNHPERGLASSARMGAQAAAPGRGVGIVLADRPFLEAAIVDRVVERYRRGDAQIVFPVVGGAPAHPVIFAPELRPRLESFPDGESLQALRDAEGATVERVDVEDPGALLDVDTEDDLARARRWAARASGP
ncbi:MAG TPA: nucleotidyltransferase family protein [Candidatus Dormibacteraeota bacterium]|nr:nucleotidyltransferase family protein [Candidatus Dormibacteraeota bacterium]